MKRAAIQGARPCGKGFARCALMPCFLAIACLAARAAEPEVAFHRDGDRLDIRVGDLPFATYRAAMGGTTRPFLEHLKAPNGVPITRNNPPIEGRDLTDHATFHPGLWLAFGDLNGADFWRNADPVRQLGFEAEPRGGPGAGSFAVRYRLETRKGGPIGEELCRITIRARPAGILLIWDSTFTPLGGRPLIFGDQEEMGLGIRMATPLAVVNGGTIQDSAGRRNEKGVWGKSADWCSYRGVVDGKLAGVVIMPDPANFRPCWFHARDYGLLAANAFGVNAFTNGPPSRVKIPPDERLRLRFGVLVFGSDSPKPPDFPAIYRDFLTLER